VPATAIGVREGGEHSATSVMLRYIDPALEPVFEPVLQSHAGYPFTP